MRFGYNPVLPTLEPYNLKLDFNTTKDLIIKTEDLGFESVWINDHLNLGAEIEKDGVGASQSGYKLGTPILECWTLLTAVAMVTKKVRLGTMVLANPFRNPAVLAKMAATLDIISGGRLEFGIGAGWHEPEFRQYGVPYGPFRERYEKLKEALEVIRLLWTEGNIDLQGKVLHDRECRA